MVKRVMSLLFLSLIFIASGCTNSKQDLIDESTKLLEENKEMESENEKYQQIENLFDFYNELSTNTLHSFVLIESKHAFTKKTSYCDGVILVSNGYDFYVMTDYNKLWVSDNVQYRVMNANAEVYSAYLVRENNRVLYDEQTGMVLLRVIIGNASGKMQTIGLGDAKEVNALISNVEQINKIEILETEDLDQYFYNYGDEEFSYHKVMLRSEGSLVNNDNKLCGFYFSNIKGFASKELIKKVAFATYSLIL